MHQDNQRLTSGDFARSLIHTFLTIVFRRKWLIVSLFVSIVSGVTIATKVMPREFESEMRILVKNERADLVVTPAATSGGTLFRTDVDETVINSELELLTSADLLKQVVLERGLHIRDSAVAPPEGSPSPVAVEQAVRALRERLEIIPVRRSNIIQVTYGASTPEGAAAVLDTLASAYLEAHLRLHRAPGAQEFFRLQKATYETQLQDAKAKLNALERTHSIYLIAEQRELALRDLLDTRRSLQETAAALAEADARLIELRRHTEASPTHIVTQRRSLPNQFSIERLNTMLVDLHNRRSQLTLKFLSDDRAVREVDEEIANTRSALELAQTSFAVEETSDLNAVRRELEEELARAQVARSGLQARKQASNELADARQRDLIALQATSLKHEDLERLVKESEESYLLYVRKQEEARISDLLDQQKISNVALAESPTVSPIPARPNVILNLALGIVLAGFVSLGSAVALELVIGSALRTASDVEAITGLPVLGSIPLQRA